MDLQSKSEYLEKFVPNKFLNANYYLYANKVERMETLKSFPRFFGNELCFKEHSEYL